MSNPYRHFCPDWDDMKIDLYDMEAVGCTCFRGDPTADALYELRSKELDEINERADSRLAEMERAALETSVLLDMSGEPIDPHPYIPHVLKGAPKDRCHECGHPEPHPLHTLRT